MQKALAPDISTWPDDNPQLIGSSCGACGATAFPAQSRCPKPYKAPTGKDFVPFGVGLVQLEDVIRVEGRLTENDPAKLEFGMDVELTMIPFTTDEDGNEIVTFAFKPV
jgi:uncharacterized protein